MEQQRKVFVIEAYFYLRVAHEVWQFEANEMDDTDTNNLLAEYE